MYSHVVNIDFWPAAICSQLFVLYKSFWEEVGHSLKWEQRNQKVRAGLAYKSTPAHDGWVAPHLSPNCCWDTFYATHQWGHKASAGLSHLNRSHHPTWNPQETPLPKGHRTQKPPRNSTLRVAFCSFASSLRCKCCSCTAAPRGQAPKTYTKPGREQPRKHYGFVKAVSKMWLDFFHVQKFQNLLQHIATPVSYIL